LWGRCKGAKKRTGGLGAGVDQDQPWRGEEEILNVDLSSVIEVALLILEMVDPRTQRREG